MHGSENTVAKPLFTVMLTTPTLLAFTVNSIFCCDALRTAVVDVASYTAIRLVSGAVTLWPLARLLRPQYISLSHKSWYPALMLLSGGVDLGLGVLAQRRAE